MQKYAPCPSCKVLVLLDAQTCPKCKKQFAPGELAVSQAADKSSQRQAAGKRIGRILLWAAAIVIIVFSIIRAWPGADHDRKLEHDELMRQIGKESRN